MKTYTKLVIVFGLIVLSVSSFAQAQDNTMVGVKVGDSFNFKVTQNQFITSTTQTYLNDLISYYISGANISTSTQYNITSMLNTFNLTNSPSVGSIINVQVVSLPVADNFSGSLNVTMGSSSEVVKTGFVLGTPIVFTDWAFWQTTLNNVTGQSYNGFTLTASSSNNTQTFNATASVSTTNISTELKSYGWTSVSLSLEADYDAVSGVLIQETLTLSLNGSVPQTQKFSIARVDTNPTVNSLSTSGPVPGFEAIALVGTLSLISVVYTKKIR